MTMPGTDPVSSVTSSDQSTVPSIQWPIPASSVSGTACAMSEPTMTAIGMRGYSSNSAVMPIAPAPTDDIVTSTPSATPTATVIHAVGRGLTRPIYGIASSINWRRNTSDTPVSNSITPSTNEITPRALRVATSKCDIVSSVSTVAGTLPLASRPTIRQLTVWLRPWTKVPTVLVADA